MNIYLASILGGLAGGVVFGIMMAKMNKLTRIARLIGKDSNSAGWVVHLVSSSIIGLLYPVTAVIFGFNEGLTEITLGSIYGALYGASWWVLGPSIIMPLLLKERPKIAPIKGLVGHAIYGAILGLVVSLLI